MTIKKDKKRVVVIGGSGFIGSNFLLAYVDKEKYDLLSISRSKFLMAGVKTLQGNFSDKEFLREKLKENDIVIHLACTTVPVTSEKNKKADYIQNVLGTKILLEVCVEKKVNKFIFMSSGGTIYGDHGNKRVCEKDITRPIGYHGKMKLKIEEVIQEYNKNYNLDFLIIRASNPFGRNRIQQKNNQGVIEVFLNKFIAGKEITIWGEGNQIRDFIYIEDLISAIFLLLEKKIKNKIINVGSGQGHSINEVIKIIESSINKRIKIIHKPSRNFDVPYNVLDISKLQKLIAWQTKYSVEEGIKKTIKKYHL